MPFTFSHIGFILPIKKKWKSKFSITGLVFGSLAPDYDILFRLTNVRFHIFQYDIKTILFLIFPLALASAFAFHLFCRNIIIDNLPAVYRLQYRQHTSFNFTSFLKKHFLRVSLSIIFAILLHLFLDFMCHFLNAYQVKMFMLQFSDSDIIANVAYVFGIYGLPILFSLIGFYLIYKYEYHKHFSIKNLAINKKQFLFWFTMVVFTILFSILKFLITEVDHEFFIDFIIISLTSSFLVAIYANCLFYYIFQKTKPI